jgi:hypothetical protein
MIRNRISCNKDDLTALNERYSWIPNSDTIRPTQEDLHNKLFLIEEVNKSWLSIKDYVECQFFKKPCIEKNGIKFNKDKENIDEWIFDSSKFRYNLIPDSNHYVLWNTKYTFDKDFDDAIINKQIETFLQTKLNHNNFDFAWYKNPKPSIPEYFHVQVFWIIFL